MAGIAIKPLEWCQNLRVAIACQNSWVESPIFGPVLLNSAFNQSPTMLPTNRISAGHTCALLDVHERKILGWKNAKSNWNIGNPTAERTQCLLNLEAAIGNSKASEASGPMPHLKDRLNQFWEFAYSDDHKRHENLAA